MALIVKNGKWHYRFQIDGVIYRGSTGLEATSRNESAALRLEMKARERVEAGEAVKVQAKPFNEAAEAFLDYADGEYRAHPNTAIRLRTSFQSLIAFLGSDPVRSITAGRLEDFKVWRRKEHRVKDVTIRHDLHALSTGYRYFLSHEWARENPVEKVKIPSDKDAKREHVLSLGEEKIYFETARTIGERQGWRGGLGALYDVARIILLQGCRPEEVMSLHSRDVELGRQQFRIAWSKSEAGKRWLDMETETQAIMARRMEANPEGFLFPGALEGRPLTKLNAPHNRVLKLTGLNFVLYDLRHTFATRKADAGMPVHILAGILGHGSLRTVQRYVHVTREAMARAVEEHREKERVRREGDERRLQEERRSQKVQ
jgi:site-specific recombinase XerD